MPNNNQNNHPLLTFTLIIVALVAVLFSLENSKWSRAYRLLLEQEEKIRSALSQVPVLAKNVSVYDITRSEKLYGKEDEVMAPIASLAKIMTVAVALPLYEENEVIQIIPAAIDQTGDFSLLSYEKWKVKDLAKLTLLSSANDGAYALALPINETGSFLARMNTKARRLGMSQALFLNYTGLDIVTSEGEVPKAGAYASALDMNLLASYALRSYPEVASRTTFPEIDFISESNFTHKIKNTNIIIDKIPNLLFSKTGFTEVAGGNLTIIFKDKRDHLIAVTILGSTFEGRFSDMEKIVEVLSRFP